MAGGLPGLVNILKTMENQFFLVGTSTISMVIFNSYVKLPEANYKDGWINYMDRLINPVAGGCICLCVVYLWMDGWLDRETNTKHRQHK